METFNMQTEMVGKQVIGFWSKWIDQCQMLVPIFEYVSNEQYLLERGLKFYQSNVDSDTDTAEKWGLRSVPTTLLLKDGKEVERIIGVPPKYKFQEKLMKFATS